MKQIHDFANQKYITPLLIAIVGTATLVAIWLMNGAEGDNVWSYIICILLVLYSASIRIRKKEVTGR